LDSRGLYGAVTVSYNLGSRTINKHLDQAANAFSNWKKVQESDVTRNSEVLKQQLMDEIQVQEAKLKSLEDEQQQIQGNLRLVSNVETSAALDFQNQLAGTQLLLGVEMEDAGFRLEQMREFLKKNY
jgi:FKBP-type peptidyl-prolyl cis-trans isomerase 2